MSKFIHLGLDLDQVIAMTTINPARALKDEAHRGSLTPGMPADITVIEVRKGDYSFSDGRGGEIVHGEVLLEPTMVFKAGMMMPAYSGYHIPPFYARRDVGLLLRGDGTGGAGTDEEGLRGQTGVGSGLRGSSYCIRVETFCSI